MSCLKMVFQIPPILKWYLNTSDSEHSWSALVVRISVLSLCAHPGTRARVALWRHAVSPPRNLGGRETIITSCRPAITWPFSLPGVPGKPTVFGGVKNIRPSPCRYSVNIAASFPVESDEVRPTLRISPLRVSKPRLLPGQCRLLLGQTLRIFLADIFPKDVGLQRCFQFPPHLSSGERKNIENLTQFRVIH